MEDLEKIVADIKAGMMTPDQVKSIVAELKLNDELKAELAAVKSAAEAIGMELKEMKTKGEAKPKTLSEIISEKHAEIIDAATKRQNYSLTLKTDVLLTSITTDKIGAVIPEFGRAAHASVAFVDILTTMPVGADSHGQVFYTDQTTTTRHADSKGEGVKAPESAIAWTGYAVPLEEIKDSIPVSRKSLNHISQLQNEIMYFINTNLRLKENSLAFSGNGTPPNMKGVYTSATAFNAGAYTGTTISDATLYDLINVLNTEITNGKESKYMPNYVVMNPADVLRLTGNKNTDGSYNIPPFVTINGSQISIMGIPVISDPVVTANTLLIGDFRHARRYIGENITLEWGYVADQFTEGMITLYGHMDELILVRNVDAGAFRKVTDITAAITAITTPAS
jgi:hypothetical protein